MHGLRRCKGCIDAQTHPQVLQGRLEDAGVRTVLMLAELDAEQQEALVLQLLHMGPRRLQQAVESAQRLLWPPGAEGTPPEALLERLRVERRKEPNVLFPHLEDLPDGPADADGQRLRVLRDSYAVLNVAEKLHNCAKDLVGRCQRGKSILVALCTASGKPKALGEYHVGVFGRSPHLWSCIVPTR